MRTLHTPQWRRHTRVLLQSFQGLIENRLESINHKFASDQMERTGMCIKLRLFVALLFL